MTGSMLQKNKIRKHFIYLKINCIILALECKNPQKMSTLYRLLEKWCQRYQLKVGVWCALSARILIQLAFFQENNKEIAHCDFRISRFEKFRLFIDFIWTSYSVSYHRVFLIQTYTWISIWTLGLR